MCVSVSVTLAISMNFDASFTHLSAAQRRKKNFPLPHYISVFSPVPQADGARSAWLFWQDGLVLHLPLADRSLGLGEGGFLMEWTCALSKSKVLGNDLSELMSEQLLRIREELAKSS